MSKLTKAEGDSTDRHISEGSTSIRLAIAVVTLVVCLSGLSLWRSTSRNWRS